MSYISPLSCIIGPRISDIWPQVPFETMARLTTDWRVAAIKRFGERQWVYEGTLCCGPQQFILRLQIESGSIIACTEFLADRTQIWWVRRKLKNA